MALKLPELQVEHIKAAIQSLDDGVQHGFGDSTKYDLVVDGKRYPPKAVVGIASRASITGFFERTPFLLSDYLGCELQPFNGLNDLPSEAKRASR